MSLQVLFLESVHSIGICLLVFRTLPLLHLTQGTVILCATSLLPSILKPICSKDSSSSSVFRKIIFFILDILAIFVQISAIPMIALSHETHFKRDGVEIGTWDKVTIGFALFLSSFSWWENFVDDRVCGNLKDTNILQRALMGLKFDLQESRPYIYMAVGFLKIGVTILTAWLLQTKDGIVLEFPQVIDSLTEKGIGGPESIAIILLTVSSLIAYYVAYTACKLKMQGLAFCLPLLLSTPVALVVFALDCERHIGNVTSFLNIDKDACDGNYFNPWYHILVGLAWLISFYWIARYIWFSTQERLAKVERSVQF